MLPARLSAYKMLSGGYTPQSNLRRSTFVGRRILFSSSWQQVQGCIFSLNNPRLFRRGDGLEVLGESFRRYIASQS